VGGKNDGGHDKAVLPSGRRSAVGDRSEAKDSGADLRCASGREFTADEDADGSSVVSPTRANAPVCAPSGNSIGPDRPTTKEVYAIAFFRCSSTLSRNPSVESHFCSGPTRSARSFVMKPASTVSTQTFSRVEANLASASLSSSLARCARPRVQAKIEAIELVEVGLPF